MHRREISDDRRLVGRASSADRTLSRRSFAAGAAGVAAATVAGLAAGRTALAAQGAAASAKDARGAGDASDAGDASASADAGARAAQAAGATGLPAPAPDPNDMFGVDLNVNVTTIDRYLNLPGVVYRDARMVFDPADWASMNADPDLTTTVEGFSIVPYPYLATLEAIPVANAYAGDTLFTLTWEDEVDYAIADARPNYEESRTILEELFPRDATILLMCGGGGYAYMTKKLLVFLGWDPDRIYNIGGNWYYQGDHAVRLIERGGAADGSDVFALWRADIPTIDFSRLHPTRD